jgi:hypothetical protein
MDKLTPCLAVETEALREHPAHATGLLTGTIVVARRQVHVRIRTVIPDVCLSSFASFR